MDTEQPALDSEPDQLTPAPPPVWHGWLVRVGSLLWVGLSVWALHGLHQEWSTFSLEDLGHAFSQIGPRHIALALVFTILSYLSNVGLGMLGLFWAGGPIDRVGREFFVSFLASAFTMNAGGSVLGGGSIRMRFDAGNGRRLAAVARVTMFSGVADWAGHALVCGILLIFAPPPLEWLPLRLAGVVGVALILSSVGMVFLGLLRRDAWPRPGLAAVALVVAAVDWACAGLALWALFPSGIGIGVWELVATVVLAQAFAAVTHVPGGIGVLEVTLTKALSGTIAAPTLAGALVVYRMVYYLLPFFVAVLLLQLREVRLRGATLRRGGRAAMRRWTVLAPRLASLLALGGGFVLLLSANTPMESNRRDLMAAILPLPFVEASHFVSSLCGATLVLLARGLQRRIQLAWWLTIGLFSGGVLFSLTKGFDWEEALILTFMLLCLLPNREHFYRNAALWSHRFTVGWWGLILSLTGASLWLSYFAARGIPYQHELWWQFAFDGDASRSLRAAVGSCTVLGIAALAQGLRPAKAARPQPIDATQVSALVAASSNADAALAFLDDKDFTFFSEARCGLMHADQGRSRIVMGAPLGDTDAADDLLWRFVETAEDEGMRPVFYHVPVTEMPRLVDMGFKLYKLGEEATVDLTAFTLEGPAPRKLRHARNHFQRSGLRFTIWDTDTVATRLAELRAISNSWLGQHSAAEKGFSLGSFEENYMRRFPCAVVEDVAGEPIAFANVWATTDKSELSVDLMRSSASAPGGVMEAMFIEIMLWGRAQGYCSFNLGMAPLSGLSTHPLAPLWNQVATRLFRRGETYYNFQGLRNFKDKFSPQWEPRYIAVPSAWNLPLALLDATALISGGLQRTLAKRNA